MQAASSDRFPSVIPPSRPRSPLWIVILGLACEEPMHPYRMQTLIKQRGKDQLANVTQRNSVYQAIRALLRARLIRVRETSRNERRPERTVYEATELGRQALKSWVRTGVATPAREFPELPALLSVLYGAVGEEELAALLAARAQAQKKRLLELEREWPGIPRVFLLESEYVAALVRAEIDWLERMVAELRSGRFRYPSVEEMLRIRPESGGATEAAVLRMADPSAPTRHKPKP